MDFYKFGDNIRYIRKAFGLSQKKLAQIIGISHTTISQYETGERNPEREFIIKFAKTFGIAENELINGDFSKMKKIGDINVRDLNTKNINKILLPLICNEESMKNENFKKGYELHLHIYNNILTEKTFREEEIEKLEKCIELYKKATNDHILEANANLIWWIIFLGTMYTFTNENIINKLENDNYNLMIKDVIEEFFNNISDTSEIYENKKQFIIDNEVDMLVNIAILKRSKEYSELGDYYLGLCYIFDLLDNGMTQEMNKSIGYEMIHIYAVLGNKYASQLNDLILDF